MAQMLYCVFLMLPLIGLPILAFRLSTTSGIIAAVVAAMLAVPLALSALAHFDLFRAKSRYGLSDEELREFTRLVPLLASRPEGGHMSRAQMKLSAKEAAADIIRQRRTQRQVFTSTRATAGGQAQPCGRQARGGR